MERRPQCVSQQGDHCCHCHRSGCRCCRGSCRCRRGGLFVSRSREMTSACEFFQKTTLSDFGDHRTCVALLLMSYSAAASKLPGSCEAVTGCPSRPHQSSPPSKSLPRNPSSATFYAPLLHALQPIPSHYTPH